MPTASHRPLRLTPPLLYAAYGQGYFPMPHPDTDEIIWFRPDPRAVLPLEEFHVSRSLQRVLKKGELTVTFDRAFKEVMKGCADRKDTWITPEFLSVYTAMHLEGFAHS